MTEKAFSEAHERLWYCNQRQAWSTAAQVGGIVSRLVASGGLFPTPPFTHRKPARRVSPRACRWNCRRAPPRGRDVVLEDFHHQCGVVGEDHAGLQHAQKADLSFSLAESSEGIDRHVSVETLAKSGGSPLVNLISQWAPAEKSVRRVRPSEAIAICRRRAEI